MEFKINENSIVYGDETRELARITFPQVAPGVVDIDHTFVRGPAARQRPQGPHQLQLCRQVVRKASRGSGPAGQVRQA